MLFGRRRLCRSYWVVELQYIVLEIGTLVRDHHELDQSEKSVSVRVNSDVFESRRETIPGLKQVFTHTHTQVTFQLIVVVRMQVRRLLCQYRCGVIQIIFWTSCYFAVHCALPPTHPSVDKLGRVDSWGLTRS